MAKVTELMYTITYGDRILYTPTHNRELVDKTYAELRQSLTGIRVTAVRPERSA